MDKATRKELRRTFLINDLPEPLTRECTSAIIRRLHIEYAHSTAIDPRSRNETMDANVAAEGSERERPRDQLC